MVPMTKTVLLGTTIAALFAVMMFASPMADALSGIIAAEAETGDDKLKAEITTDRDITSDGSEGAFGYGVVTIDGGVGLGGTGDSLMVATTHAGVLDSAEQSNQWDPVWHNHYVQLKAADPNHCANTILGPLEVDTISFESPGKVKVDDETLELDDMPAIFAGTNALSLSPFTWHPNTDAELVVSFTLNPVDDDGNTTLDFKHVCVENVVPFGISSDSDDEDKDD